MQYVKNFAVVDRYTACAMLACCQLATLREINMPIVLIIASLGLNGQVGISAHPVDTLQGCGRYGFEAITSLTQPIGAVGSGPASYYCYKAAETGVLTVIAYVDPVDSKIIIRYVLKPTGEACAEIGKIALAFKIVPGAMSYSCFEIPRAN
jgi:hypothetical protein